MQMDQVWKHHLRSGRARTSLVGDPAALADLRSVNIADIAAEMADEDEQRTLLVLMAAAEAALRTECARIAVQEAHTPRGAALLVVCAAAKATAEKRGWTDPSPSLPKLLDTLRKTGGPACRPAITGFLEIMKNRHWLAHGRHWAAPAHVDAVGAWSTIRVLFGELAFPMPVQPNSWV